MEHSLSVKLILAACLSSAALALTGCDLDPKFKEAKEKIETNLIDPGSAQYRNLRRSHVYTQNGSFIRGICGEVNAKNRMGGYVGFKPFLYVYDRKMVTQGIPDHWPKGEVIIPGDDQPALRGDVEVRCSKNEMLPLESVDFVLGGSF